jgi:hypothetical protein
MRQKFNDGKFWERVKSGDLKAVVTDSRHPTLMAAAEPHCTYSQEVSYRDADDNEIARVHQYLRPDGNIGASGLPDPKRVLIDGVLYRLAKKKDRAATDQG